MSESEEENVNVMLAFLNMLQILSDTTKFRKWLNEFHEMNDYDRFFDGYKFAIITCLIGFMESFTMHDPFKLKQDEICYRAEFRGIKLDLLPNSCEKIILQKNIWNLGKRIRKALRWEDLNVQEELFPILELFSKIKDSHLNTAKEFTVDESLNYLSEFYAYLFLIDTSHGRPKGYYHPFLSIERSTRYLDRVFDGYAFSLQYIWYKLLGEKNFQKSCVRDLHRSQELRFDDDKKYVVKIDLGKNVDNKYYKIGLDGKEKKEQQFRSAVYAKWKTIDQFFSRIKEEEIRPLERKTDFMLNITGKGLVSIVNFKKTMLGTLLEKTNLEEPPYMKKNDLESLKKKLDLEFLWYELDVLNAGGGNLEFNGVFAFNALLTGYVELLKKNDNEGKIKVLKIIHPEKNQDYNYYSMAILIGSHGFFSDSSGWIVFFDSLIDSPGTGGHYRDMCFECVERFRKESLVDLKEITVDKKIFQSYLESRKISFSDFQESSNMYKDAEDNISKMKGKLFEYVFHKYCIETNEYEHVHGDFTISGQQIDCIGKNKDVVYAFECKLQYHAGDFKKYLEQMSRITDSVKKKYSGKIYPTLVFYYPIPEYEIEKIRKKGINVMHNFKNEIFKSRTFDGEKQKISYMLDFDLRNKFYRNYDREWFS